MGFSIYTELENLRFGKIVGEEFSFHENIVSRINDDPSLFEILRENHVQLPKFVSGLSAKNILSVLCFNMNFILIQYD